MLNYLKLARVHQYIKNFFVLAPLFFSFKLLELNSVVNSLVAFFSFCMFASAIYILNDLLDIKSDILHPKKKYRLIASGKIAPKQAIVAIFIFLILGILISFINANQNILYIISIYLFLNILYSLKFKHIVILDIVIISIGFCLRVFVGSVAINTTPSNWIIILTFLLSLFLAVAKRRDDVIFYERENIKARPNIDGYNKIFCDITMAITASVTIVVYILWSVSDEVAEKMHSEKLYLTSIFVLLGILRYMQITFVLEESGSPTKVVLKDRFLKYVIFFWIISFIAILYI